MPTRVRVRFGKPRASRPLAQLPSFPQGFLGAIQLPGVRCPLAAFLGCWGYST